MSTPKKKSAPRKRSPRKAAPQPDPEASVGVWANLSRFEKVVGTTIATIMCGSMIINSVGSWRDISVNDKRHDAALAVHDKAFVEQGKVISKVESDHDDDVDDLENENTELGQRIMTMQTNMSIQTAELNNMRVAAERTTVALESINEKLTDIVVKTARMEAKIGAMNGIGGP